MESVVPIISLLATVIQILALKIIYVFLFIDDKNYSSTSTKLNKQFIEQLNLTTKTLFKVIKSSVSKKEKEKEKEKNKNKIFQSNHHVETERKIKHKKINKIYANTERIKHDHTTNQIKKYKKNHRNDVLSMTMDRIDRNKKKTHDKVNNTEHDKVNHTEHDRVNNTEHVKQCIQSESEYQLYIDKIGNQLPSTKGKQEGYVFLNSASKELYVLKNSGIWSRPVKVPSNVIKEIV